MQIFNKKVNNLVKNGINITFYKKIAKMVEKFDTINVRKKMVDLLKKNLYDKERYERGKR